MLDLHFADRLLHSFVHENLKMKNALKILNSKKLGFLLVRNKKKLTKGIITDGELRRFSQKNQNFHNIPVKRVLMMPGLDKQEDYHERTKFCMEMGKKYGYTALTRLHVSAWDQLTGV